MEVLIRGRVGLSRVAGNEARDGQGTSSTELTHDVPVSVEPPSGESLLEAGTGTLDSRSGCVCRWIVVLF
jgi:hypothetical protein